MSNGLNKACLIGNLGAKPELRATENGTSVCNFRVATSRRFVGKNNEKHEQTEWHRVVAWGKLAEHCEAYLEKGRQVYIEGRLQTRAWDDRDGNKRYTTEVVAETVTFLGGNRNQNTLENGNSKEVQFSEDDPVLSEEAVELGFANNNSVPF